MSTSKDVVQDAPSYGLYQRPDTAAQLLAVTTEVPPRLSTVSLVLQAPLIVI